MFALSLSLFPILTHFMGQERPHEFTEETLNIFHISLEYVYAFSPVLFQFSSLENFASALRKLSGKVGEESLHAQDSGSKS